MNDETTTPNILLIHSDQHRYDCVGANGHPFIQTPAMDRLAREGVNFSHAFCPIPLCTPARNCLLTGQWPTGHGCIANYDAEAFHPMLPGTPTFSQCLRDHGYRLGYIGKWHVDQDHDPTSYGFHDYVPLGEHRRWLEANHIPLPPPRQGESALLDILGHVDTHFKPEQTRVAWGASATIARLERYAKQGEPFFLRWDPIEPHLPNNVPLPYAEMYPAASIAPWRGFADTFADKPYIQQQQLRTWGVEGWTWEQWVPHVQRYLGDVTLLDHQLGRVLEALDHLGLSDDTLVIYTSDHGDMTGSHGMVDKQYVMYDDVVRVPLLMRWPGRLPAGLHCPHFVCQELDLATTFCRAAGIAPPETFRGINLIDLAADAPDVPRRSDIFAMYHGNQMGLYSQRMVRDRRWKYVWNATAQDELYDLQADPGELRNVAMYPENAGELTRLRQRLVCWMVQINDRLLNRWTRNQLEGSEVASIPGTIQKL